MKRLLKIYLPFAIIVAVSSEILFYPLSNMLRISLGVVVLSVINLINDDLNHELMITLSGFVIVAERLITSLIGGGGMEVAFSMALPSLIYYLVFAALYKFGQISKYKSEIYRTVFYIAIIDMISNFAELMLRGSFKTSTLFFLVLVGLIRAMMSYTIYYVWRKNELVIIKKEHKKRYGELNQLVANVESELFYLRKSADDIESVMSKCYDLYDDEENNEQKKALLDISKDIHEIKKDYLRVLNGFQDFVNQVQTMDTMKISEVFDILSNSYEKNATGRQLIFEFETDEAIDYYLSLFTILNNLVDNSICACGENGAIHVSFKSFDDYHQYAVIDNGTGIEKDLIEHIFNPGFTTKYDEDGKASTGIGLTHVKNTVEQINGHMQVESIFGSGTKMMVYIKKDK